MRHGLRFYGAVVRQRQCSTPRDAARCTAAIASDRPLLASKGSARPTSTALPVACSSQGSSTTTLKRLRKNTTIDWTLKESVKANLRRLVRRILNKYGYPPDLQEEAVQTVLKQAELLCADWVR